MSTLTKMALAAFAGLLIGGGAFVGAQTTKQDSKTVTDTVAAENPAGGDVKGPCDEAEHANQPRCDGPQVPEDNDADEPKGDNNQLGDDEGDDHGGALDNSGPGNAHHGDDDGDRVDNSGPGSLNSGPGNAHDDDEGDEGDDDNSGSGSSDSGSGHQESDHSGGDDD